MGALVAGSVLTSRAQSTTAPTADPGPGLIGTTYSEVDLGTQRHEGHPRSVSDLGFVYNSSVVRSADYGFDANLSYDYLTGRGEGVHDFRNELLGGFTGYLLEPWGKPFVTVDGGWAWQRAGDVSRKGYVYTATSGVEFQVLKNLALTPFIEYLGEPKFYNHSLPIANFPDYSWDYGVKATYRIDRDWSASLTASLDQYRASDLGLRAGLSYHF